MQLQMARYNPLQIETQQTASCTVRFSSIFWNICFFLECWDAVKKFVAVRGKMGVARFSYGRQLPKLIIKIAHDKD